MSERSGGEGWRGPVAVVVGALIGAAAIVVAALIANRTGVINISLSPGAGPTIAVTASPLPTNTATVSPGGIAAINCPSNNNCKIYDLTAGYEGSGTGRAGIVLESGTVDLIGNGDNLLYQASGDGSPEIIGFFSSQSYSLDVTAQNASRQQCIKATGSAPDPQPITQFYKGMLFCAADGSNGVALIEEMQPLDSSNTLHLREIYWPNP